MINNTEKTTAATTVRHDYDAPVEVTPLKLLLLGVLMAVAVPCMCFPPSATDDAGWWTTFMVSKSIGLAAAYAMYRLCRRRER